MSVGFRAVQWSTEKRIYDVVLVSLVAIYISMFMLVGAALTPPPDSLAWIDLRIRAFGSAAFLMLTAILAIGPLARLDPRFLKLLYNRRHFGVLTFAVAVLHALFMLEWYWARDALPDLAGELTAWGDYAKFIGFPFKVLGIAALLIMLVMAATSHDYWLAVLTPPVWKALHMSVYAAYGLVVMHVALGVVQFDTSPRAAMMVATGFSIVAVLHLMAGSRERHGDRGTAPAPEGWIAVGPPDAIPDKRAKIVTAPGGERIAVFRDGGQIGAVSNLCAHQNGPLGEGRIVDGCITCPWHGYQYRLENGCAPPPFTEKLATYRVRLRDGTIEVDPQPLPPGTPAAIECEAG
jgi:nitrite reductase/ring-hydroxylating ferredoxin subunit/DMSO/TMAO reductase YedYZ heme-binding membrane subunit